MKPPRYPGSPALSRSASSQVVSGQSDPVTWTTRMARVTGTCSQSTRGHRSASSEPASMKAIEAPCRTATSAASEFADEVRSGAFPGPEHSFE